MLAFTPWLADRSTTAYRFQRRVHRLNEPDARWRRQHSRRRRWRWRPPVSTYTTSTEGVAVRKRAIYVVATPPSADHGVISRGMFWRVFVCFGQKLGNMTKEENPAKGLRKSGWWFFFIVFLLLLDFGHQPSFDTCIWLTDRSAIPDYSDVRFWHPNGTLCTFSNYFQEIMDLNYTQIITPKR